MNNNVDIHLLDRKSIHFPTEKPLLKKVLKNEFHKAHWGEQVTKTINLYSQYVANFENQIEESAREIEQLQNASLTPSQILSKKENIEKSLIGALNLMESSGNDADKCLKKVHPKTEMQWQKHKEWAFRLWELQDQEEGSHKKMFNTLAPLTKIIATIFETEQNTLPKPIRRHSK